MKPADEVADRREYGQGFFIHVQTEEKQHQHYDEKHDCRVPGDINRHRQYDDEKDREIYPAQ